MKLVLLSQDLMIGSHLSGTTRQLGLEMVTVSDPAQTIVEAGGGDCAILFLDIRLPGLDVERFVHSIRENCSEQVSIVACGPHVHEAKLTAARKAGCDAVVTRGQFDREAGQILGRLLEQRSDARIAIFQCPSRLSPVTHEARQAFPGRF